MFKKILMALLLCLVMSACHSKTPFETLNANADQLKALYSLGGTSALGSKNASVTLVNIFSYDCSYCRREFPLIEHFAKVHSNVKIIFKPFLAFAEKTNVLPQYAALAAAKQGQFLAMNHALMTTNKPLNSKTIHSIARELNLNMDKFNADIQSKEVKDQIDANTALMADLNIDGIPTVIMATTKTTEASHDSDKPYIQMGFISNDILLEMLRGLSHP